MAYERKPNKGAAFEVDSRTGKLILSGRINIQEWHRNQEDEYDPRVVVLRNETPDGEPRLEVFVQLGVLFPADEDKKYAYSGPCGVGKIFAYAEEKNDKRFLNLSIADDRDSDQSFTPKEKEKESTQDDVSDDIPF